MPRFTNIAKLYDSWSIIDSQYGPMHDYTVDKVVRELSHSDEETPYALEIGVGTGHTTEAVLLGHPRVRIRGIDEDSEMIALANKRLKRAKLSRRVRLSLDDASHYLATHDLRQVDGNGFCSVVFSVCTMHNIKPSDRLTVCRESHRVLRKGGMFISGDKIACNRVTDYLQLFDAQIRAMELYRERGMNFEYDFWRIHELEDHLTRITGRETIQMLQDAGFERVRILKRFGLYAVVVGYKPV